MGAIINIFLYSVKIAFEPIMSKVFKEWIMLKSIYVKINFYYVKPLKWKKFNSIWYFLYENFFVNK